MPAMQASVPLLAPESQLTRIAGIDQMIESVSSIAGPALGALLLAWTGKMCIRDRPEGVPGTNPGELSKDPALVAVYSYF